jgi:outer membrane biosynthesis protein TonB
MMAPCSDRVPSVNTGDTPAVPLTIPADIAVDLGFGGGNRRQPLSSRAMVLAALLHIAVPLIFFFHWPATKAVTLPAPIPVALVVAPPPEAPAPAPAAEEPPRAPYLESGPGQRTTALAPAEVVAPEAARPPADADAPSETPAKEPPQAAGETPSEKPLPAPAESTKPKPKPHKEIARAEPVTKEAAKPQAPTLAPPLRHLNIQLGDKNESGDPYLNRLLQLIEAHRIYPRITGQFGLLVEGVPVYVLILNRQGAIVRLGLVRSSGNPNLDQVGATMIQQSAPLPPLPANIPEGTPLELTLPLYPQS